MITCSVCNAQSPDGAEVCVSCGADLAKHRATTVARAKLRENPRVRNLRVIVAEDACPACRQVEGAYAKDDAPDLPVLGCSHPMGCRCFYEPALTEIYP